jgi:hypothetical protein
MAMSFARHPTSRLRTAGGIQTARGRAWLEAGAVPAVAAAAGGEQGRFGWGVGRGVAAGAAWTRR